MKSIFLAGLLGAQVLFAAPIFCHSADWDVVTNTDLTTAKVLSKGSSQPVEFGDLSCFTRTRADGKSLLSCASSHPTSEQAYNVSITLELPGVDMTGTLSEHTIAGLFKLADLNCVGAVN